MKTIKVDRLLRETEPATERIRVLIVDDSLDNTRALRGLLEKTGRYLVAEENDPDEVSQAAWRFVPDVILLDVVMPETDGGEVAARLQDESLLRQIPIIFLTGLVTQGESDRGLRIAGHRYLAKPAGIARLVNSIENEVPNLSPYYGRRLMPSPPLSLQRR